MVKKVPKKKQKLELEQDFSIKPDVPEKVYVPNPDNVLDIKTQHGIIFKNLFDALKASITEANLVFTKKGLKLTTADTNMTVLVHLFMYVDSFEHYFLVEDEFIAGIDIELVHRTMKANKSNNSMCFVVNKDSKKTLSITFENEQKRTKVCDEIPLRDLQQGKYVDTLQYPKNSPEIDASTFQNICKEMVSFNATLLEIKIINDELIFTNLNGEAKREVRIKIEDDNSGNGNNTENCQSIVPKSSTNTFERGVFLLAYLKPFSKAASISNRVKLFLKTNFPLTLEYSIGNHLGTLKYLLTPEGDNDEQ